LFTSKKGGNGSLQLQRLFLENICFYPVGIFFLLKNWKLYIWCFFIPQMMSKIMIITINLLQHDGCPEPRGQEEPEELAEDEKRLGLENECEPENDEIKMMMADHEDDHEEEVHATNLKQTQYYDKNLKRWFK